MNIVSISLIVVVGVLAMGYGLYWWHNVSSVPFESTAWQNAAAAEGEHPTIRQQMLPSLLSMLDGATAEEVENWLGTPVDTNKFQSFRADMIYYLGPEPGLGIDSEWLLLTTNMDGVVESTQVVTD